MLLFSSPSPAAAETSLGAASGPSDLKLYPGQQEIVEVSFFNAGETDLFLYIDQTVPMESSSEGSDLQVYVMQKKYGNYLIDPLIQLDGGLATRTPPKASDTTWVAFGDKGNLYVPAKKAYFLVKVRSKSTYALTEYNLIFRVMTEKRTSGSDSAIALVGQIREFPVHVRIMGISPNPSQPSGSSSGSSSGSGAGASESGSTGSGSGPYLTGIQGREGNLSYSGYQSGDNYINTYNSEDDTLLPGGIGADPDSNLRRLDGNDTNESAVDSQNMTGQNADDNLNPITGLLTGSNGSSSSSIGSPFNILTILIILLGAFILYRALKTR